jgi:outer membrane biosynthesis protein TonB
MAVTFSLKHGVYIFSKTADTPLARYQKQVRDVIGSKWYSDLYKMMDMFRLGTARLVFRVDRHGQVRDLKVIQNTNNEAFANYCIQSVREAKLPPMPEDLAATLPPEGLRADFPFTVFADVKSLVR